MNNISDAKYVFTIIGGGWSYCHDLYIIKQDNSVFYAENYDKIETAELKFLIKLDDILDFEEHTNNVGFDAPDCTMYIVKNGKLKKLYHVGMYGNTPAVEEILKIQYYVSHGLDKNGKNKK